jgi:hypothetical protein
LTTINGILISAVCISPGAYKWASADWEPLSFDKYVIYELHVGSFTPEGTFGAALAKLDHIAAANYTAVQLMPITEHSDAWGYNPRCAPCAADQNALPRGPTRGKCVLFIAVTRTGACASALLDASPPSSCMPTRLQTCRAHCGLSVNQTSPSSRGRDRLAPFCTQGTWALDWLMPQVRAEVPEPAHSPPPPWARDVLHVGPAESTRACLSVCLSHVLSVRVPRTGSCCQSTATTALRTTFGDWWTEPTRW